MLVKILCLVLSCVFVLVLGAPALLFFLLAASLSPVPEPGPVPAGTTTPPQVLAADEAASTAIGSIVTGCVVPVWVLLAVGKVESDNASGHTILPDGDVSPPIIGPALDGSLPGTRALPATDGGALTGDPEWSHAVGPMQILPSTWQRWAHTERAGPPDPQNVDDAALTAAVILCQPPADLADPAQLAPALAGYNHSGAYASEVLAWAGYFETSAAPSITSDTQPASS